MPNQWTSTRAFDRARAEGRAMARDDFARASFPDERNLRRIADGHCARHNLKNASIVAGAWLEGYHEALAALFAELRERLATFDASPEDLFCPGPGDALALRWEG